MMVFGGLTRVGTGRFELRERVGILEAPSSGGFVKNARIDIYGITRRLDLSRFHFEY